jgi:trk system potassium uptake protein
MTDTTPEVIIYNSIEETGLIIEMQEATNPNSSYHPRPGDKVFRVPRTTTWRIVVPTIRKRKPIGISLWSLVYTFLGLTVAGTILLMLPFSSNSGQWSSFMTCLFTSTSSVCTTGLVVVDTLDHWSFYGQLVILILVQIGGLGFMTSTSLLLMAAGRKIGLRDRLLIGESAGITRIGGVIRLARNITYFTFISELIGAGVYLFHFLPEYGWKQGIWNSIFQSVSAFNNAAFDLFGSFRGLSGHAGDYLVLLSTAGLIILGSISFIVIQDTFRSKGFKRSSVDTKLVLIISGVLWLLGTAVVLAAEYHNPQTIGGMPLPEKILNAFFLSVSSRSAGFSTFSLGTLSIYSLFTLILLMFIGGASNSTAGGIKVNTLGVIVSTIWNTIKGRENPQAFGRELYIQQLFRSMVLLVLSLGLILVIFLILSLTEHFSSLNILFETVSAFGIVGLSTGITPLLSVPGELLIILLMLIGRLGPLTLIMVLSKTQHITTYRYPKESVRIG